MPSSFARKATGGNDAVDRDEVRRALSVLIDPDQTFEIRGLLYGGSRTCKGSDLDAAVDAAIGVSGGIGVYLISNPCRHDLDRPARNEDVLSLNYLLHDADTKN